MADCDIEPAPTYHEDRNAPVAAKRLGLDLVGEKALRTKVRVYGHVLEYIPDLSLIVLSSSPSNPGPSTSTSSSLHPTLLIDSSILTSTSLFPLKPPPRPATTTRDNAFDGADYIDLDATDEPRGPPKPLRQAVDEDGSVWKKEAPWPKPERVKLEKGMGLCVVGWVEEIPQDLQPSLHRVHLNPAAFAKPPSVIIDAIHMNNVSAVE